VSSLRIRFKSSALRELETLPDSVAKRIFSKIEALGVNPRPAGCKKLVGGMNHWRVRVGEYRVVYVVDDNNRLVEIMRIRHRSSVYN
jgi:mRNA interferase RelE/StbE